MIKQFALATLALAVLSVTATRAADDRELAFPENYRTEFTRYYNSDRLLEDEQTIRIYANRIAWDGAQKDGKLPSGSVLVAEIYAAKKDADGDVIESTLGRRIPGAFKAIALMERRDGWDDQYADDLKVGNWEFEVFSPVGENLGKDTTSCRECHHPLTDTEFIFSIEHLMAAN